MYLQYRTPLSTIALNARQHSERLFWEQIRFERAAMIEAELYKAGVPSKYLNDLSKKLKKTDINSLRTALLLYNGLEHDTRLIPEDRVNLIPALIGLVKTHGEDIFLVDKHLDNLVEIYLSSLNHDGIGVRNIRHRTKDTKTSEGVIKYGSPNADILYGERLEQKYRAIKPYVLSVLSKPSNAIVNKAKALFRAINRENWRHATEIYSDLLELKGHLFQRASTYKTFLYEIGSILLKHSPNYKVKWVFHERHKIPIGYSIIPPEQLRALENESSETINGRSDNPYRNKIFTNNKPALLSKKQVPLEDRLLQTPALQKPFMRPESLKEILYLKYMDILRLP